MKKILLFSAVALATISCGKQKNLSPAGNCNAMFEAYSASLSAYIESSSEENCQAVIKNLDNIVNNCTFITAEQRREYNRARSDMSCKE